LFHEYDLPNVAGASVLVIRDGKVLFKKAYGLANLENRTSTNTNTNYRLASMTKQFTAMAIMMLAEGYGYTQKESGFEQTDQSLTSSTLGDGSVYSSVDDLFKWEQVLYTTRFVSAETLKRAFNVGATIDDPKLGYGFGWFIGEYRGLNTIIMAATQ
jgi:hypothetical protein